VQVVTLKGLAASKQAEVKKTKERPLALGDPPSGKVEQVVRDWLIKARSTSKNCFVEG
jgi:hypothetical protein